MNPPVRLNVPGVPVPVPSVKVAEEDPDMRMIRGLDTLLWHSIASIALPGVIVHQTVKGTKHLRDMSLIKPYFLHS